MTETIIFRDYGQAELDDQYNNRKRVPENVELYAAFQADSETVLGDFDTRIDVPFGPSAEETLDIILPENPASGGAPVNVFLHGGFWYSRHKNDFRFLARGMVPAGGILVIVNYALVPSVDLDELVRQCRAAVAWTYDNAADFGGDKDRIHVSGWSAGGHLTAMMMATDWPMFGDGLPKDLIKSGTALSGIYDITPIRMTYMQETLGLTPDQVANNSPMTLAPTAKAPLIIAVGGNESDEFIRQSEDFAETWGATDEIECRMMTLDGINHFTILSELADPKTTLTQAMQKQMGLD